MPTAMPAMADHLVPMVVRSAQAARSLRSCRPAGDGHEVGPVCRSRCRTAAQSFIASRAARGDGEPHGGGCPGYSDRQGHDTEIAHGRRRQHVTHPNSHWACARIGQMAGIGNITVSWPSKPSVTSDGPTTRAHRFRGRDRYQHLFRTTTVVHRVDHRGVRESQRAAPCRHAHSRRQCH